MMVMIVDDSNTMRKITALALTSQQHQFIEAENGKDALAKLAGQKIDLFIVDVNMPVMNGLELVKELRSKPESAKTPILMLTTENDEAIKLQGKNAGVNAWIVKPFKNDVLLDTIKTLI
jgi:two-component system, chemotaxis family, chemotaxis protein CheY